MIPPFFISIKKFYSGTIFSMKKKTKVPIFISSTICFAKKTIFFHNFTRHVKYIFRYEIMKFCHQCKRTFLNNFGKNTICRKCEFYNTIIIKHSDNYDPQVKKFFDMCKECYKILY